MIPDLSAIYVLFNSPCLTCEFNFNESIWVKLCGSVATLRFDINDPSRCVASIQFIEDAFFSYVKFSRIWKLGDFYVFYVAFGKYI